MDKSFFISENDNYAGTMTEKVEPWLAQHRKTGYFKGYDGNKLYYESYTVPDAKATVVVCHGFTECGEKFREMFWYFLNMGYNVFAPDHRGHGHSFRYNDDPETIAIRHFEEYVDDLDCFINSVVKPASGDLPLYIYSHSMGGAVTVQYLQTHPGVFSKAVLSAPMIAAKTAGIPYGPAKILMGLGKLLGQRDKAVIGSSGFNPKRTYENSHDTSKPRFDYYQAKRVADRTKQTANPSFGWVAEAIRVAGLNLDKKRNEAIKIPVLLFQPVEDSSVYSEKENEFIAMIPNGRLEVMEKSKHEVYMAVDETLEKYLTMIEEFFAN